MTRRRAARGGVKITSTGPPPSAWTTEQEVAWRSAQAAHRTDTDAHTVNGPTPCRCCGGPVQAGHGVDFGVWRTHVGCPVAWPPHRLAAAAKALLSVEVSEPDAQVLTDGALLVHNYADGHPEPTWGSGERPGTPWGHVHRKALRSALDDLPRLRVDAGLEPSTCTTGSCAWCGVAEALGWFAEGHHWPDGSDASLCGDCHAVYLRAGSPSPGYWDDQRDAISEAITGAPAMMGERPPPGLLAFAETAVDSHTGTGAWEHLNPSAVDAYRWAVWGRFNGQYAPPEHRAEALDRVARKDAVAVLKAKVRQADADAKANVYGF